MGLFDFFDDAAEAFRFKDTVFYKEDSDLQAKYDALVKLKEELPDCEELEKELVIVKKGLEGENEIAYQLKKSSIGMYVLRDVQLQFGELTAQIDYVIITPVFIYYVECKNLIGNITVNEKGDFIREFVVNGRRVKKGMYSPLRQVEAQREVVRKIWESETSMMGKVNASRYFDYYRRVLVVAANKETILDLRKAPKDMKYKVLRADGLVKQIEYDIDHCSDDEVFDSRRNMEITAQKYLSHSKSETNDFYEMYKSRFEKKPAPGSNAVDREALRAGLLALRTKRSREMGVPAYYVFTNNELESLLDKRPKTTEELKAVLPQIKIKVHGESILTEINGTEQLSKQ